MYWWLQILVDDMKILTVVYSLGKGGTERAAQNFALAYKALGHDSRLVFTRLDGPRKYNLQREDVPVSSLLDQADIDYLTDWEPEIVHLHSHGLTTAEVTKVKLISGQ